MADTEKAAADARIEETAVSEQTHQRNRPALWPYLVVPGGFLLVLATGPVYTWYSTTVPVVGANIGYGLGFMWTAMWGMPWSIWPFINPPARAEAEMAVYIACGLLNFGLLSTAMLLLRRRIARSEDRTRQDA